MSVTAGEIIDIVARDMAVNVDYPVPDSPISRESILRYIDQGQKQLTFRVTKIKEDYLSIERIYTAPWPDRQSLVLPDDILINKIRLVQWLRGSRRCVLTRLSLAEYAQGSRWEGAPAQASPDGWRAIDVEDEGGNRSTRLVILPERALTEADTIRVFYIRRVPELANESDRPFFPESDTYLEDYAKWKIAQVDPSRTTELYETAYENSLRNLLETFTDRAPQDGGSTLELDESDRWAGMTPVEDL